MKVAIFVVAFILITQAYFWWGWWAKGRQFRPFKYLQSDGTFVRGVFEDGTYLELEKKEKESKQC